jgi:ribosome maturation factor RimP
MNHTEALEIKAGVDLPRVRAAIDPVLAARGVALVDLEWLTERSGWILRLSIERLDLGGGAAPNPAGSLDGGGCVTLADCAEVSRDVSALLDVEDFIHHRYHLEVSSPGVDRPLRTEAEFARFAGQTAKVKLSRPAPDGQRVLRGHLDRAPSGRVAVVVDGNRLEVPFADVAEANLVLELGAQPKTPTKKTAAVKGSAPRARTSPQKTPARPARSS